MSRNLNTVKTVTNAKRGSAKKSAKSYHHGALREALVAAATEIIENEGPDGFSLRAAARKAGVSSAAPAYHFGDARGLLSAVAIIGFRDFANELEAVVVDDRRATIAAVSHAYLRFAQTRPGMFRLMWRTSAFNLTNEELYHEGLRAFRVLDQAVRGTATSELIGDLSLAPTIAAWCLMHGFSALSIDEAFFADDPTEKARLGQMLDAVFSHLTVLRR
jgi:AcrR family transcriptional regulator